MNVRKMINILIENEYELDGEDHNLVMHDLYTTYLHDLEKGEKNLERLVEIYTVNLRCYHGYKNDQDALEQINEILYEASQCVDEIMGGSRVEEYFVNTMEKLKIEEKIENKNKSLAYKVRYDKKTNFSSKEYGAALHDFELNKNPSGPIELLYALAFHYKNNGPEKIDPEKALLKSYMDLDSYSKEVDGTLNSRDMGPVQKYFRNYSMLVN